MTERLGPGPLDGVRVLDLTRVLSGPHCTRMLVDLGADVIKVEPPDGDGTRLGFPKIASISTYFSQQNCGKSNISFDLHTPDGRDLLLRLVDHADIFVENFRPDVLDRLGLGWDVLHARNPRLIQASITGFGRTGPWAMRRAYAPVVSAEMGITSEQAKAFGGEVRSDTFSHADVYTSLECLAGVLAALYQRERSGRGQRVEVSMADTMLSVNEHLHWTLRRDLDGVDDNDFVASYRTEDFPILTTASGTLVIIAGHPAIEGSFQLICQMMQRLDLLDDERLATVALRRINFDVLTKALTEWAAPLSSDEAMAAADAYGFATGVVRTAAEAATSAWAIERGAIVEINDRAGGVLRVPNSPIRFSDGAAGVRGGVRYRGEDNRTVLTDVLGLDDLAVDDLEQRGVLSSRMPRST